MAFIFADLIVLPIMVAYRKYYGLGFALRITVLMFVTMVLAALVVDLVFGGLGLVPDSRPSTEDVFGSIQVDYKLVLNVLGLIIFAALFGLTLRRGVIDPVCGMSVDRGRALRAEHAGQTYFFCSEGCRGHWLADHPHARSSATGSSVA
jgi:YHS domain-containing protein